VQILITTECQAYSQKETCIFRSEIASKRKSVDRRRWGRTVKPLKNLWTKNDVEPGFKREGRTVLLPCLGSFCRIGWIELRTMTGQREGNKKGIIKKKYVTEGDWGGRADNAKVKAKGWNSLGSGRWGKCGGWLYLLEAIYSKSQFPFEKNGTRGDG